MIMAKINFNCESFFRHLMILLMIYFQPMLIC